MYIHVHVYMYMYVYALIYIHLLYIYLHCVMLHVCLQVAVSDLEKKLEQQSTMFSDSQSQAEQTLRK